MKLATGIIAAALGWGAFDARAAPPPATTAQPGPAQVEPKAVDALTNMSAYLRSVPAFQIDLRTQRDDVDVYGQLITLSGEATYKVRRPDVFAIDLKLPSLARQYVDDGKTVTLYDPGTGYYGKFPALPTVRASLERAETYGATVPLDDLFTWTEGDPRAKALTSAHFIGRDRLTGQDANHYAFRQPGVDWQIWIADGDKPMPLRVILVASDDPARPKFQADLAWDTAPKFSPDAFAFTPPRTRAPRPSVRSNEGLAMPHLTVAKISLLAGTLSLVLSASVAEARGGARAGGGGYGGARSAPMSVNGGARGGNYAGARSASVNRNANVNVNRNVNVSGGCCHNGGYYGGGVYHPVAAGMAVGAVTGMTAAAVSSAVAPPPPAYAYPPPPPPAQAYPPPPN